MPNLKPMIFVIMSSEKKYDDFYTVIRVMAADVGAEAKRADDDKVSSRRVRPEIINKIQQADIIVAEISSNSPNVFYELGFAHALGKPAILFAEHVTNIPYDIQDYRIIKYDYDDNKTIKELETTLWTPFNEQFKNLAETNNFRLPIVDLLERIDKIQETNQLFRLLSLGSIKNLMEEAKLWLGDSISINQTEAVEKGIRIFKNMEFGGFATYLVNINDYWNMDNDYLRECRNVARNEGKKIIRVYILPNFDSLNNNNLKELMRLDEDAKIETKIVFESDFINKEAIQDFGIWDDSVVCLMKVISTGSDYKVTGGYFSCDQSDLEKARNWKNLILSLARPASEIYKSISNMSATAQLLFKAVYKMELASERYCQGSYLPKSKESCKWYHNAWPYLRLLGLVSTPDWHDEFYINALGNVDFSKIKNILICGTADYSMLSYVLSAIPINYIRDITISIIDVCQTPLEICRWFKEQYEVSVMQKFNLRYENIDALDTQIQEETVDLIITDAFLTRFTSIDKTRLVSEWRRILRPNGSIITTARMTNKTNPIVKANQMQIDRFCDHVKSKIDSSFPWLRQSMNHIISLAHEYGENMCSYPFQSEIELRNYFSGFNCHINTAKVSGEFEESTVYFRIVAQK